MKKTYTLNKLPALPPSVLRDFGAYINEEVVDFNTLVDEAKNGCEESFKRVVSSQLPLMAMLLKKNTRFLDEATAEDMAQECILNISRCVHKYDDSIEGGATFPTFVFSYIQGAIYDFLSKSGVIRLSMKDKKSSVACRKYLDKKMNAGMSRMEAIAKYADEKGETIGAIEKISSNNISIEPEMIAAEDGSLIPHPELVDEFDMEGRAEQEDIISHILNHAGDQAANIARLYGVNGAPSVSYTDLANESGVSAYHIKKGVTNKLVEIQSLMRKQGLAFADFDEPAMR